jgi:hypothetical protein
MSTEDEQRPEPGEEEPEPPDLTADNFDLEQYLANLEDTEEEPHEETGLERFGRRVGVVIGGAVVMVFVLAALALVVGALIFLVYATLHLLPDEVPAKANPDWLDLVFANRYVIFSVRLVLLAFSFILLFGGLYVVGSMIFRMTKGQWLHRAGWFEAEVEDVEGQLERATAPLYQSLQEAWGTNEDLANRLEAASQQIQELQGQNEGLYEALLEAHTGGGGESNEG